MAQKSTSSPGGARRLRQFIVCLLLFGLIAAGRGLDLAPVERAVETVTRWVGADTDFRAVFARMGESFSRGEPAAETFHTLWSGLLPELTGPDGQSSAEEEELDAPALPSDPPPAADE